MLTDAESIIYSDHVFMRAAHKHEHCLHACLADSQPSCNVLCMQVGECFFTVRCTNMEGEDDIMSTPYFPIPLAASLLSPTNIQVDVSTVNEKIVIFTVSASAHVPLHCVDLFLSFSFPPSLDSKHGGGHERHICREIERDKEIHILNVEAHECIE